MDRDAVSSTMPLLVFRTPLASVAVNVAEQTREGRNDSGSQRAAGCTPEEFLHDLCASAVKTLLFRRE